MMSNVKCRMRYWLCTIMVAASLPACTLAADTRWETTQDDPLLDSVITAMLTMQRLSWEHAAAAQALHDLGELKLATLMAEESALRQLPSGRYDRGSTTDVCAIGQVMALCAARLNDDTLQKALEKNRNFMKTEAKRAADGTLFHTDKGDTIWVDSMYMAPPVLAAMGEYEMAIQQVRGIRKRLWNKEKKLFHHIYNEERRTFENPKLWGVGNGWAVMGMTRTTLQLPPRYAQEKREFVQYIRASIDGFLHHQRDDGLSHFVLDESDTFVDTGAPMCFAYAIYMGIDQGWLDRAAYLPEAEKIRAAACAKVDGHGFVQDACGLPGYKTQSRSVETQSFFIHMEAARRVLFGR